MAILRTTNTLAGALLAEISAGVDSGAGAGTIDFYTTPMPATADTAVTTQTLLGTCTFSDPSQSGISGHTLTFDVISDDASADATGTCVWARIKNSTGTTQFDVDVGVTGSGATAEMNTVAFEATKAISISSFTISIN